MLSNLITFKIYGEAWKWTLMDMTNPCWKVWPLSHLPLRWTAQAQAEPRICFKRDPSWEWIVRCVCQCGNGMVLPTQPVTVYPVSKGPNWTPWDFLGKISHYHQLELCCDLNKSGVDFRMTKLFFFWIHVGFLPLGKKWNAVDLFSL